MNGPFQESRTLFSRDQRRRFSFTDAFGISTRQQNAPIRVGQNQTSRTGQQNWNQTAIVTSEIRLP